MPEKESVASRHLRIVGVPLDLGQSRRGVDMGPSAVRVAGLKARLEDLGHQVEDLGNIPVEIAETRQFGDRRAKYLREIAETCRKAASVVRETLEAGAVPIVLGGDHSVAIGSVTGAASFARKRNQRIGLVWIDAHADMNTPETSPSGNVHGMPMAALLGQGPEELTNLGGWTPKIAPENVAMIGVREIDDAERKNILQSGVQAIYTMRHIDERGIRSVLEEALSAATGGTMGFHVSLDMDWLDPQEAPGVGTPVRGGATYREAHLAMEILADYGSLLSCDVVEINPIFDEHNRTADLAAQLLCSAFGKKIL